MDAASLADAVLDAIDGPMGKPAERIRALEAKIVALEARPVPKYVGLWKANEAYSEGLLATHQGALWYCNEATASARPGDGSRAWTLAVKSGSFNGKGHDP